MIAKKPPLLSSVASFVEVVVRRWMCCRGVCVVENSNGV